MTGRQRVLVTAGASGIGECVARAFARDGARVHICDSDERAIEQMLAANQGVITGTLADVSDPDAVDRLFDHVESVLGGLDVLVNNAGIAGPIGPVEDIAPEAWRRTIEVNLDGQFLCARKAVPLLKSAGGGCIINMSSTAGLGGCPNRSPYVASKWAIIGLTKTLAMELGIFGIRVNAICPGSVEGERIRRVMEADAAVLGKSVEEVRATYVAGNSMRTLIQPEEIASLARFLCAESSSHITGQALGIDGHTETLRA
ncbi:MAG: SDR family oxidoreductase [Deltaproteobacteria bacterium]|nr:SDR family oxidoreductase [Deltaproteobacteria bacterium]MBW2543629.1 SDR family oxidoreductase [Deltaproteobacteria bacterium]